MLVFVDLDETLISSDVSVETLLAFLKNRPLEFFRSLATLCSRGRAAFKHISSHYISSCPETLPYRPEVLEYLRERKQAGDELVLLTASHQKFADEVASFLGIFDQAYGSSSDRNIKGKEKLAFIKEKFPGQDFSYLGDSEADFDVWSECKLPVIVASSKTAPRVTKLAKLNSNFYQIVSPAASLRNFLSLLRVHQWSKNILLFIPAILAHRFASSSDSIYSDLLGLILAFFSFSLVASAVYILNDLLDIHNDRQHPSKKHRAFASGKITPQKGVVYSMICFVSALFLATILGISFLLVILCYFSLNVAYSLKIKQIAILDIVLLAGMYTLRLIAGGVAVSVLVSPWLKAFSMFVFLSLASVKRVSELIALAENSNSQLVGRGYKKDDLSFLLPLGISSGLISVLVLALYIHSKDVTFLYSDPNRLWLVCPIMMFWILRVWFKTHRGEMDDDPVVFALTDRVSYVLGLVTVYVLLSAV